MNLFCHSFEKGTIDSLGKANGPSALENLPACGSGVIHALHGVEELGRLTLLTNSHFMAAGETARAYGKTEPLVTIQLAFSWN